MINIIPPKLREALRDNIKATVTANLEKMNLLTREQFEVQEKVLHRTRERVTVLEKQVDELEKRLKVAKGE